MSAETKDYVRGECACHDHDHDHHESELTPKALSLLGLGVVMFIASFILNLGGYERFLLLPAYAIFGAPVIVSTFKAVFIRRALFDEAFLMTLATVGAFAIGEWAEAVAVMLFYRIGETLQSAALDRSRGRIRSLMALRPDTVFILADGRTIETDAEHVEPGEIMVVRPGDRVALDGIVETGSTRMNTSAITGESAPRRAEPGDEIFAGFVNEGGVVTVRVTRPYGKSAIARILELTESAAEKKTKMEGFLTRFSRVYTPGVVILALMLAFLPPLFGADFNGSAYRALTFLVISCPCALVLSIPLTFFAGVGAASRSGVLVKGAVYLEALSRLGAVAFDKTGTLTSGELSVTGVFAGDMGEEEMLSLTAHCEACSTHPIAKSIVAHFTNKGGTLNEETISCAEEIAGMGAKAVVGGRMVLAGNEKLLDTQGVKYEKMPGLSVLIAVDGAFAGGLAVSDSLREGAKTVVDGLKSDGIKVAMLTGDRSASAQEIARSLGITEVHSELMPADKARVIEGMIEKTGSKATAFVGDGVNDAPVLARADVGIAMGGLGSQAAVEAADVVVMDDSLTRINAAVRISKTTMKIAAQNIAFILALKAAILLLGALGITGLWMAIFADVGVSLLAVLNSLRVLGAK